MKAGTALVTGAYGFVGPWLVRRLVRDGWRVVAVRGRGDALSRPATGHDGVVTVVADVRDESALGEILEDQGVDTVLHLAGQTIVGAANRSPTETFEVNVRGTWTVLEACRRHQVGRTVVASTDKAYGPSRGLPFRENFPLAATFPYEASKAAADLLARSYWHTYGLPVAVTRFANIYGGGDGNLSRLIPATIIALLDGRAPVIRSDGSPERQYLYVEDAVDAYLAVLGALDGPQGRGEAFNAGAERTHSVREVIDLLLEIVHAPVEVRYGGPGSAPGELARERVDTTKLRELTGWRARIELEEGLRRTVAWYRERRDHGSGLPTRPEPG